MNRVSLSVAIQAAAKSPGRAGHPRRSPGEPKRRHGPCWLVLFLLCACAGSYTSPDDPALAIPDRSPEITIGRTDRGAVRESFGEPFIASLYWQFDLFRTGTEQTEIAFALTPWPVPFARFKDQLLRYTLVTYDSDGLVTGATSGVLRKPTAWRSASPIRSDYLDLRLHLGDLLFAIDQGSPRQPRLLASAPGRDRYLGRFRNEGSCTLVLGCGPAACADRVAVDAGEPVHLPLRILPAPAGNESQSAWPPGFDPGASPWLESLVPVPLDAGERALEFSARFLDGNVEVPLTCVAGDIVYGVIRATAEPGTWRQSLVDWRIDFSTDMPAEFRDRPLVLTDDERWLLPPDPGLPAGSRIYPDP